MSQRQVPTASAPPPPAWTWADTSLLTILSLSTAWAYASVGAFGFVSYDDPTYVVENPWVHGGWTLEGVRWALTTFHFSNWHPLTWLSYLLDVELFGVDPGAMHLVNVGLHVANAGLVHLVMRQLGANALAAAFVAALFALHPLHVESVAWISERKGLLSTAVGLGSISLYIRWTRTRARRDRIGCALLLAAGLAAKPMLVSWPLLLLLLDWGPLGRIGDEHPLRDAFRCAREKLDLFALTAASSVVTVLAQRSGGSLIEMERLAFGARLENALWGYARYLQLSIWPTDLAVIHPHPEGGVPLWILLTTGGLLLAATVAALAAHRRARPLAVGWLWYLLSLVPVIGIVQVGSQSIAERYTYVPLLGIFAALIWLASQVWHQPVPRRALAALGVAALAALTWTSERQVNHWRSSLALFSHAVASTGPNFVAQIHLGTALVSGGDPAKALGAYRAASQIVPGHPLAALGAASALASLGRLDEAAAELEAALRRNPSWAEGHAQMGNLLLAQRRFPAAQSAFGRAVELAPELPEAHNGLGASLANQGDLRAAIPYFEQAVRLRPAFADAQRNLATARAAIEAEARP